jgi:phage terminase small subunit
MGTVEFDLGFGPFSRYEMKEVAYNPDDDDDNNKNSKENQEK